MNWPDILTRAGKTALQALFAALAAVPLFDLTPSIALAAAYAAIAAGLSVVQNALAGAERSQEARAGRSVALIDDQALMIEPRAEPSVSADADTRRITQAAAPIALALLLPGLFLAGCGLGPAPRQGVELLGKIEQADAEREATLRKHLGIAWREQTVTQLERDLEEDVRAKHAAAEAAADRAQRLADEARVAPEQVAAARAALAGAEQQAKRARADADELAGAADGSDRDAAIARVAAERAALAEARAGTARAALALAERRAAQLADDAKAAEADARAAKAEAQLTVRDVMARTEQLLVRLDRQARVLDGYAAEAAQLRQTKAMLRDRVAGALRALEERNVALEALGEATVVGVGAVAELEATRTKARRDEAAARLLEEQRLEREAEAEGGE